MQKLAPQHVGRRVGLSVSRLIQLDREGILPAERDSAGRRFYDPDVIEAFVQARQARRAKSNASPCGSHEQLSSTDAHGPPAVNPTE